MKISMLWGDSVALPMQCSQQVSSMFSVLPSFLFDDGKVPGTQT